MTPPYPQFISNTPVGEDLFEGKSQEKVARYICENLIGNDKCKIVGIDGGWGTGKSNLIEITKKKLNDSTNGKYHFFIYDAWGHQEDLQRRSILEELTEFLTGGKVNNGSSIIGDPAKWNKKLKALLAKSKETEKKTVPSLSLGVVFSGLLFLSTPIFKGLSEQFDSVWLKILIVTIPLISLTGIFAYYYIKKTDDTQDWKTRLDEATQKLFYLYQKSQKSDTTFETISEEEPSVKKFREWMREIAGDLGEKRLIIVFDNMDRLPDNKITELWSSIHTFFAEEKYDNIKVIIPFDRQNIKNAFKHTDESKHSYTNDFINKTFDIVYRVSPPILSDWKKFFESKWLQAFNTIDDEFYKVLQIFDHLAICKTPREMVVFVNECVANNQINPLIPLRYVSLFVLNKSLIFSDSDKEILRPSYLKSLDFLYQDDEDLPKFIAALIYQIDPDRAIEVVFSDRLKNGLNNNDKGQVALISESSVFPILLDKAIIEVSNLMNTSLALNELGNKVSAKTWDDLYYRLGMQQGILPDSKVLSYQLVLLIKVTDKANYLKTFINLLVTSAKFTSVDYYTSIQEIIKTIKANNLSVKIEDFLIDKKVPSSDFVTLLKVIPDSNTYKVYTDNTDLNNHLESLDSAEEWTKSDYLALIPDRYIMAKFTNMLTTKIKEHADNSDALRPYVIAYKNVSKGLVKVVLTDDAIRDLFLEEGDTDQFYYDIISMRIARWEGYNSAYAADFDDILDDDSKETVEGLKKGIQKFVHYGDLLLKLPSFNKPLIKAVAKEITINCKTIRRLHLPSVLIKIDEIIAALDIEPQILLDQLGTWKIQDVTKAHIVDVVPNINFFSFAANYDSSLSRHLNLLALEYFQELPSDKWLTEFKNPHSKQILTSLIVLKTQYPPNATSAIKEVLEGIAAGNISIQERLIWVRIIDKLNKNTLRATMKNIRDMYVSNKDVDVSAFEFFGDWLFEYGDLSANKGTLRRIFRKSILQASTIAIAIKHSAEIKKIFNSSEDKEDFKNEIKVMLSEKNTDIIPLAELLDIHLDTQTEG